MVDPGLEHGEGLRWGDEHVGDEPVDREGFGWGAEGEAVGPDVGDEGALGGPAFERAVVDGEDASPPHGTSIGPTAGSGSEVDDSLAGLGFVAEAGEGFFEFEGGAGGGVGGLFAAKDSAGMGNGEVGEGMNTVPEGFGSEHELEQVEVAEATGGAFGGAVTLFEVGAGGFAEAKDGPEEAVGVAGEGGFFIGGSGHGMAGP